VADCGDAPGTDQATVANCCDPTANEWVFQTCSFSEFFLGGTASDLVPSKGNPKKNCVAEWVIDNPLNDPYVDKAGFPNFKQTCMDGDAICDKDGVANGTCVFAIGVCFNLDDPRLTDKDGNVACTPSDLETWKLKKPRPDSSKPFEAANALALRDAVQALGTATIGGKHQEELTFSPGVTGADICTAPVLVELPLKGPGQDRRSNASLKMQSITSAPPEGGRGTRDSDKLKLTCLPSDVTP
jgi:hypothetical protein